MPTSLPKNTRQIVVDVPPEMWREFTEKCHAEGKSARQTLVRMIAEQCGYPLERLAAPARQFVYLISADGRFFKIGRTRRPAARLSAIATSMPFAVQMEHLIAVPDSSRVERDLHERFKAKWVRGEWFALSPADVKWFKRLTAADLQENS